MLKSIACRIASNWRSDRHRIDAGTARLQVKAAVLGGFYGLDIGFPFG